MPALLRVASLNVWALPSFISPHVPERMAAIVDRAAMLGVDVLVLQEVWTARARAALKQAGRKSGYEPAWPEDDSPGGLFVLSVVPVNRFEFTRFLLRGLPQRVQHADYYGRKGFMVVEVATAEGPAVLTATHLHARYGAPGAPDEYLGIRAAQIAQLAAGIHAVATPCVVVGDFNLRENDPEYRTLIGLAGLVDAAAHLDSRQPTTLAENPYHGSGHHPDERIDYVFTRNGAKPTAVRRDFDTLLELNGKPGAFSDHAGLVVDLEISPTEAARPAATPEGRRLALSLLEAGRVASQRRRRSHRSWGIGLVAAALVGRAWGRRLASSLGLATAAVLFGLAERLVAAELGAFDEVAAMLEEMAPAD